MKARIKVRPLENNCHTLFNGKDWSVVHKVDIKAGLIEHVDYLRRIGCEWSANQILKCIRVS